MYGLQSFIYSFSKNALIRTARLATEAASKGDYTVGDRMRLATPAGLMAALLIPLSAAVFELRYNEYPELMGAEPVDDEEETPFQKTLGYLDYAGLTGGLSPYVNLFESVSRYRKDPASVLVGPTFGEISSFVRHMLSLGGESNSPNTNTAERNATESFYENFIRPVAIAGVSALPLPSVAKFGLMQAVVSPGVEEGVVSGVAGEKGERTGSRERRRELLDISALQGGDIDAFIANMPDSVPAEAASLAMSDAGLPELATYLQNIPPKAFSLTT